MWCSVVSELQYFQRTTAAGHPHPPKTYTHLSFYLLQPKPIICLSFNKLTNQPKFIYSTEPMTTFVQVQWSGVPHSANSYAPHVMSV